MSKKWSVCTMVLGGGHVDRTVVTRCWPHGDTIHVPYVSVAATDGEHKVVIDTGARIVDTVAKPYAHRTPEEELQNALRATMGWELDEVDMVINTHLHYDHCGGNHLFPRAQFFVQRDEWDAARDLTPYEQQFYDRVAYSKDCVNYFRWNFLHGEEELAPGLRVLPAPGHTRGSQIVLLDTEEGAVCFPGDTVTTQLNLEKNLQPNIVVNDKQLFESMDLVRRVAQRIIFSHDDAIKTGMRGGFYKVPNPWEK